MRTFFLNCKRKNVLMNGTPHSSWLLFLQSSFSPSFIFLCPVSPLKGTHCSLSPGASQWSKQSWFLSCECQLRFHEPAAEVNFTSFLSSLPSQTPCHNILEASRPGASPEPYGEGSATTPSALQAGRHSYPLYMRR